MSPRLLALLSVLVLVACSSVAPPRREAFYRLVPPPPPAEQPPMPGQFVVRLEAVRAQGVYADSTLLGRSEGSTTPLYRHYYDRWTQAPATLISAALAQRLIAACGASRVRAGEEHGDAQWTVHADLRALDRIVIGNGSRAELSIDFAIEGPDGQVLAAFNFERTRPTADASLSAYVGTIDQLVGDAGDALVSQIRQLAERPGRPASAR
jgi:ABC-type uncharacterized transport system auxiliary subunit